MTSVESQPTKRPEASAPRPTPIPASVEGFYSWDSHTGLAQVDAVLTALATNPGDLADRLLMVNQPCPVAGVNGPIPCEAGKPNDSPIPVFRYFWCDASFLTPAEAAGTLNRHLGTRPALYAAYELKNGGPAGPGAKYGILMAGSLEDPSAFLLYLNAQGQIVGMKTGCGKPGAVAPAQTEVTYLLPPLAGQEAKGEQSAYITSLLHEEGNQVLALLAYATGETDCAGLDCSKPVPLTMAQSLKVRCNKIGPESLREAGGYDPALHKDLLDAFEAVCAQAAEVVGATPAPEDKTILATFEAAKARLKGALQ